MSERRDYTMTEGQVGRMLSPRGRLVRSGRGRRLVVEQVPSKVEELDWPLEGKALGVEPRPQD